MPQNKVIVVGAGIAGLGVAGILQAGGLEVMVLEKSRLPGGRAKTREFLEWRIDSGTHCVDLGDKSPYARLLERVGTKVEWSRPIEGVKLYDNGRWMTAAEYLGASPDSADQLAALEKYLLNMPDEEIENLDAVSLQTFLDQRQVSGQAATYLKMLAMVQTTLTDAENISAGEFAYIYREEIRHHLAQTVLSGVRMPRGGISKAIEAQAAALISKGGLLKLDHPVTRVEKGTGGGWSVWTKDERYQAPTVVLAVPLWKLGEIIDLEDVNSPLPAEWRVRIRSLAGETSASMGFTMGVKGTILTEPVYLACWRLPGIDLPLQCLVHTVFDESIAPSGHSIAFIGAVCQPGQAQDAAFRKRALDIFWELTKEMFPGIEDNVVWKQDGFYIGIDGLARSPRMIGRFRPPVYLKDVPGLYFAGDCYTGRGIGMNAAANSAMICADRLVQDLK